MNTSVYCAVRLTVENIPNDDDKITDASEFVIVIHTVVDSDENEIEIEDTYEITPGDLSAASRQKLVLSEEGDALAVEVGIDWLQEQDIL